MTRSTTTRQKTRMPDRTTSGAKGGGAKGGGAKGGGAKGGGKKSGGKKSGGKKGGGKKTGGKKGGANKKSGAKTGGTQKKADASTGGVSRGATGRVTIKSVAEAAGVSIATVSFVLNKRAGQMISEPVKKRVYAAAEALNYAPSAAAAGLARKQTANVAIVFYGNDHLIANPLYSFVVQGAIKEAIAREFNIMFSFMEAGYKSYSDLPKIIRERNAEGVFFVRDVSGALVGDLRDRGIATVAVDSHPYVAGLNTLYVDNTQGAKMACRHLIELGHQDIAFLFGASDRPSIAERKRGFLDELKASDLGCDKRKVLLEAKELTFDAGYAKARAVLERRPDLTGIFCANDELAAGVLRAARELGLDVPKDLSVIGFDDITMARYLDPPLTTIGFDKEAMGRRGMSRLLDLVSGQGAATSSRELLEVGLVNRSTTAPR